MADATFDLRSYISNVKFRGIPTASKFFVEIVGINDRNVWLMCEAAQLPGLSILTAENRTFGELRESPYGILYQPINMTFLLDNSFNGKKLFEDWANDIFDRKTRTSGYYKDYVRDINIHQTDKNDNIIYSVTLHEAFPKTISELNVSYESKDLLRLNVTMMYKYWVEIDKKEKRENLDKIQSAEIVTNSNKATFLNGQYASLAINDNVPLATMMKMVADSLKTNFGVSSSKLITAIENSTLPNQSGWASSLGSLTSGIGAFGSGLSSLSDNLSSVVAPISALGSATSAISQSLGAVGGLTQALGLGNPFSKSINDLTKISGQLGTIAGMNGLPGIIGNVGSTFTGVSGAFTKVGETIAGTPGATTKVATSFKNLGTVLSGQANSVTDAANKLADKYGF